MNLQISNDQDGILRLEKFLKLKKSQLILDLDQSIMESGLAL